LIKSDSKGIYIVTKKVQYLIPLYI